MDVGQIVENTPSGKIGSALVTIILAGFLWVGKTTFEHVGQVAGIRHQLDSTHQSDTLLRGQYDEIVSMLNERTKSRFTREDADKLVLYIKEVESAQIALKDRFLEDHADLKIEIANITVKPAPVTNVQGIPPLYHNAVASSVVAGQRIQQLEGQIASLQSELARLQRHVGVSRENHSPAFETPRTLIAQPNLDRASVTRR